VRGQSARKEVLLSSEVHKIVHRFSLSRVLRGSAWVAADNWTQQILQFISFLYVGNIIGPAAIGEMTVALTYMLFMHALLMNSMTDALIQRDTIMSEHEEALFWGNAGMGLVAMLVTLPIAPVLAHIFGEPQIAPLIMAISPVCLAMGMISFFEAKIRRELKFAKLAGRSIVSVGTAFLVAVILAHRGFGVWSLVVFQLVWRGVELIFVATVAAWRPRGTFSLPHLVELLDYSLSNLGVRLVDFFAQNAGRIVVGLFFGMHALGIYQLARRLVEAPLNAGSGIFQSLMLPILARLQGDRHALGDAVARTVQAAGFVLIPAFVGLLLVAPVLVQALLRPEWAPAVPLVQIFALAGLFTALTYFFGTAILARGKARLTLYVNVAFFVIRIGLYGLLAIPYGLAGLALAEAGLAALGLIVWFVLFERETHADATGVIGRLVSPLFAALVMALAVEAFRLLAERAIEPPALLVGMIVTGLISFAATAMLTGSPEAVGLTKLLRARR